MCWHTINTVCTLNGMFDILNMSSQFILIYVVSFCYCRLWKPNFIIINSIIFIIPITISIVIVFSCGQIIIQKSQSAQTSDRENWFSDDLCAEYSQGGVAKFQLPNQLSVFIQNILKHRWERNVNIKYVDVYIRAGCRLPNFCPTGFFAKMNVRRFRQWIANLDSGRH